MLTEADTCRKYVLPKLYAAGWSDDQISEQKTFTDGRIVVAGERVSRRPQRRADYLLRYTRDFMIGVIEAKAAYKNAGDGLQQAKEYAQILDLKFAYSTNGHGIVEHDFLTGRDRDLDTFPSPADLWQRIRKSEGIETTDVAERLLTPSYHLSGKSPRYYQEIAFAKTIVFCVDQEHAEEMRKALNNESHDLVKDYPDYVCRVVSDEGQIGRGHLSRFQELETASPVILTTSQMLTTGVDVPTCKNVVLARVINSMTDFKQIIGRGTRVRDDYGKLYFSILDYTGSATRLFADPDFDGDPAIITEEQIDDTGSTIPQTYQIIEEQEPSGTGELPDYQTAGAVSGDSEGERRKYYVDGGTVEIAAHLVYELDPDGKQLRVVKFTEYTAEKVRSLYTSAADLRAQWSDAEQRATIIAVLEERGISFEQLAEATRQPDADPFDLLCHVAFNAPLRSRRERAERLRKEEKVFFDRYRPEARQILDQILEKYAEHGTAQFKIPEILKVQPVSNHGNVLEITEKFGGPDALRKALAEMQSLLYAA